MGRTTECRRLQKEKAEMTKQSGSPGPPTSMLLRSLSWCGGVSGRSLQRKNTSKQSGLGASVHETLKFGVRGGARNHFAVFFCPDYFSRVGTQIFKQNMYLLCLHNCFYISCPDYFSGLRYGRWTDVDGIDMGLGGKVVFADLTGFGLVTRQRQFGFPVSWDGPLSRC